MTPATDRCHLWNAEHLGVECDCWCHMDPQPEYDSHRDYFETHGNEYCGASCTGMRWLLREPCGKTFNWGTCPGVGQPLTVDDKCPSCGRGSTKVTKHRKTMRHNARLPDHTLTCICDGRGYLLVTDPTAILAAIREKGWQYLIDGTWQTGDFVKVVAAYDPEPQVTGITRIAEGLRAPDAVPLALARALAMPEESND